MTSNTDNWQEEAIIKVAEDGSPIFAAVLAALFKAPWRLGFKPCYSSRVFVNDQGRVCVLEYAYAGQVPLSPSTFTRGVQFGTYLWALPADEFRKLATVSRVVLDKAEAFNGRFQRLTDTLKLTDKQAAELLALRRGWLVKDERVSATVN